MGQDDNHRCERGFAKWAVVLRGPPQNERVRTEGWVAALLFCPGCGAGDRGPTEFASRRLRLLSGEKSIYGVAKVFWLHMWDLRPELTREYGQVAPCRNGANQWLVMASTIHPIANVSLEAGTTAAHHRIRQAQ